MRQLSLDKTGVLEAELSPGVFERVELTRAGEVLAVVISVDELAAMQATQQLFATVGALAAIAEGQADLAAGRADDWSSLRSDHGRGIEPDSSADAGNQAPTPGRVLVSHRARWDLELVLPAAAAKCCDRLDELDGSTAAVAGHPLSAGFPGLQLLVAEGWRMVFRSKQGRIEIVHIDADPVR